MAKTVYKVSAECLVSNKTKQGSVIQLANNVQQTEKGPTSRQGVSIVDPDPKIAAAMDPGKKYTVTITEE